MFYLLLGLMIVAIYMLIPYLACRQTTHGATTWIPINHSFKYGSDDNVYAALVNSVRQRGGGFDWPAADCPGCRDFEILRVGSYRLAALLGGGFTSPRWLHLTSQVVSVVVHYFLAHIFIWLISGSSLGALLGGLCYLFYFNALMSHIKAAKNTFRIISNKRRETYFDAVGDHFRYVILSVASLFGLSSIVLAEVAVQQGYWWYAALGLMLSLLPFSYPGTLVAFGLYCSAFLTLHQLADFDPQAIGMLALGVAPMLLFTLVTGRLRSFLMALRVAPPVMSLIHCGTATANEPKAWRKFCRQLFTFPVSLTLYSTLIAIAAGVAIKMNLAALATAIAISALGSFPGIGRAVARMQQRGAATLYQIILYATLTAGASKFLDLPSQLPLLMLFPLGYIPLRGAYRMFRTHQSNRTYEIETGRWNLYSKLRAIARPDDLVSCIDVRDMQLAPVYAAGTAYVGGGEWLSEPAFAISRQASIMQHCGIDPRMLIDWMETYFEKRKNIKITPRPSTIQEKEIEGAITLNHLVFYPYINQFDGVPISTNHREWTPEFRERFIESVNKGMQSGLHPEPRFIIISAQCQLRRKAPATAPTGYQLIFEEAGIHLYGLTVEDTVTQPLRTQL